jgi:hypothetical protein
MLSVSSHHFNAKGEHSNVNSCWHLVYGGKVSKHNLVLVLPIETVKIGGNCLDGFYNNSNSSLIKKIEIMLDYGSPSHNFSKLSKLMRLKEKLGHFFNVKGGFFPLFK